MGNLLYYIENDQFWAGLFVGVLFVLFIALFLPHFLRVASRRCGACNRVVLKRPKKIYLIISGRDKGKFASFIFRDCRCGEVCVHSYNHYLSGWRLRWISLWEPEVFTHDANLFKRAGLILPNECIIFTPWTRQPKFVGYCSKLCHALSW